MKDKGSKLKPKLVKKKKKPQGWGYRNKEAQAWVGVYESGSGETQKKDIEEAAFSSAICDHRHI